MGKISQAPALGDLLLSLLPPDKRPAADYQSMVTAAVLAGQRDETPTTWLKTIQTGGRFSGSPASGKAPKASMQAAATLKRRLEALPEPKPGNVLMAPPSIRFFDGRGANRPWLIETPDTLTQIPWQTTALIHPQQHGRQGIADGDDGRHAENRSPVRSRCRLLPMPAFSPAPSWCHAGQGHTDFGRWAAARASTRHRAESGWTDKVPVRPRSPFHDRASHPAAAEPDWPSPRAAGWP
jgi:hypothetical protein